MRIFLASLGVVLAKVRLGGIASSGADLDASLPLPEKDRPVLAAAIRHRCEILVTGDRSHFGRLYGTVAEGVEILAPAALAEKLFR